jgi:protein involved in polysaccharide export with SLBB domain
MKSKSLIPLLLLFLFAVFPAYAQVDPGLLSEEFMEGLPASVRGEIDVKNKLQDEEDIQKLFQSETSLDKTKILLQKIKGQLSALEDRFDEMDGETNETNKLERFGDKFFQSIQSSFMPINIPNLNNEYVLDVGDGIDLTLSGGFSTPINSLDIGRDGSVLIPGYGLVELGGLTISQAEEKIENYFKVKAPNITPYMQVTRQKDIQILIMGMVEAPGIYTISSGSNVVGALNVAGGISPNGSYRYIEHKRKGELINKYDLYDLFVYGNFDYGYQLRSGDVLFVSPKGISIPVSGAITNPAIYEIKGSETLTQLLSYAGGFTEDYFGYDTVSIKSNSVMGPRTFLLKENDFNGYKLQPRDAVLVPSYSHDLLSSKTKKISVLGSVRNPGEFSFQEGERLSDIIEKAGGYKDNAYIYGAALFRKDAMEKEQIYAQLNYSDTVNFIISNIGRPGASVGGSALDLLSEELRANRFEGRVIANFDIEMLKSNPALDLELTDGDVIIIPSMQKIVYMFGDFRNPSNTTYNPKYSLKDYLKLAGGTKESAYKQIIVIDPDGKTNIYNTSIFASLDIGPEIYPGSIIYAPRDIGKLSGVQYASTVAPILSSLAISLASLNSIKD